MKKVFLEWHPEGTRLLQTSALFIHIHRLGYRDMKRVFLEWLAALRTSSLFIALLQM
jgi:hypothetical protein